MTSLRAADSNLLIYAFDTDNLSKHLTSLRILDALRRTEGLLPMQCLAEFYSVTVRKGFLKPAEASSVVENFLQSVRVIPAQPPDLVLAMSLHHRHKLQFFDALILATLAHAQCTTLFSEDMQHAATYAGVQVLNPFLLAPADFDRLLA